MHTHQPMSSSSSSFWWQCFTFVLAIVIPTIFICWKYLFKPSKGLPKNTQNGPKKIHRRRVSLPSAMFFERIKTFPDVSNHPITPNTEAHLIDMINHLPNYQHPPVPRSLPPSLPSSGDLRLPQSTGSFPPQIVTMCLYLDGLPTMGELLKIVTDRFLLYPRMRSIPTLHKSFLSHQWCFDENPVVEDGTDPLHPNNKTSSIWSRHLFFHLSKSDDETHHLISLLKECDLRDNCTTTVQQDPSPGNNNGNVFKQPLWEMHLIANTSNTSFNERINGLLLSHNTNKVGSNLSMTSTTTDNTPNDKDNIVDRYQHSFDEISSALSLHLLPQKNISPTITSPKPYSGHYFLPSVNLFNANPDTPYPSNPFSPQPIVTNHPPSNAPHHSTAFQYISPGGPGSHVLLLRLHHAIGDGAAVGALLGQACTINPPHPYNQPDAQCPLPQFHPVIVSDPMWRPPVRLGVEGTSAPTTFTKTSTTTTNTPITSINSSNLSSSSTPFSNALNLVNVSIVPNSMSRPPHHNNPYLHPSIRPLTSFPSTISSFYYAPAAMIQRQYQDKDPGRFKVIPRLLAIADKKSITTTVGRGGEGKGLQVGLTNDQFGPHNTAMVPKPTYSRVYQYFARQCDFFYKKINSLLNNLLFFVTSLAFYIHGSFLVLTTKYDSFTPFTPRFPNLVARGEITIDLDPTSTPSVTPSSLIPLPGITPPPTVDGLFESRSWRETSHVIFIPPFSLQLLQDIKLQANVRLLSPHLLNPIGSMAKGNSTQTESSLSAQESIDVDSNNHDQTNGAGIEDIVDEKDPTSLSSQPLPSSSPRLPDTIGQTISVQLADSNVNHQTLTSTQPQQPQQPQRQQQHHQSSLHKKEATNSSPNPPPALTINDVALALIAAMIRKYQYMTMFVKYGLEVCVGEEVRKAQKSLSNVLNESSSNHPLNNCHETSPNPPRKNSCVRSPNQFQQGQNGGDETFTEPLISTHLITSLLELGSQHYTATYYPSLIHPNRNQKPQRGLGPTSSPQTHLNSAFGAQLPGVNLSQDNDLEPQSAIVKGLAPKPNSAINLSTHLPPIQRSHSSSSSQFLHQPLTDLVALGPTAIHYVNGVVEVSDDRDDMDLNEVYSDDDDEEEEEEVEEEGDDNDIDNERNGYDNNNHDLLTQWSPNLSNTDSPPLNYHPNGFQNQQSPQLRSIEYIKSHPNHLVSPDDQKCDDKQHHTLHPFKPPPQDQPNDSSPSLISQPFAHQSKPHNSIAPSPVTIVAMPHQINNTNNNQNNHSNIPRTTDLHTNSHENNNINENDNNNNSTNNTGKNNYNTNSISRNNQSNHRNIFKKMAPIDPNDPTVYLVDPFVGLQARLDINDGLNTIKLRDCEDWNEDDEKHNHHTFPQNHSQTNRYLAANHNKNNNTGIFQDDASIYLAPTIVISPIRHKVSGTGTRVGSSSPRSTLRIDTDDPSASLHMIRFRSPLSPSLSAHSSRSSHHLMEDDHFSIPQQPQELNPPRQDVCDHQNLNNCVCQININNAKPDDSNKENHHNNHPDDYNLSVQKPPPPYRHHRTTSTTSLPDNMGYHPRFDPLITSTNITHKDHIAIRSNQSLAMGPPNSLLIPSLLLSPPQSLLRSLSNMTNSIQLRSLITVALPRQPFRLMRNVTSNSISPSGLDFELMKTTLIEHRKNDILAPWLPHGEEIVYVETIDEFFALTEGTVVVHPGSKESHSFRQIAEKQSSDRNQSTSHLPTPFSHHRRFVVWLGYPSKPQSQIDGELTSGDNSPQSMLDNNHLQSSGDNNSNSLKRGQKVINDYNALISKSNTLNHSNNNNPIHILLTQELCFFLEFYPYFNHALSNRSSSGFITLLQPISQPITHHKKVVNQYSDDYGFSHPSEHVDNFPHPNHPKDTDLIYSIYLRTQKMKQHVEFLFSALLMAISIKLQQLSIPLLSPLILSPLTSIIQSLSARAMNTQTLLISNIAGPSQAAHLGAYKIQALTGCYIGQQHPFVTIVTLTHKVFLSLSFCPNMDFIGSLFPLGYWDVIKRMDEVDREQKAGHLPHLSSSLLHILLLSPNFLFPILFRDELKNILDCYEIDHKL